LSKIRAFFSLNVESSVKEKAAEIQRKIKETFRDYPVKWEDPDKFHLTVRFLGDIEESEAELLIEKLNDTNFGFDKITYVTNGIGFFPNIRRPNVVFIGLEEEGSNSQILVDRIDKTMLEIGIKPDKKFVAHITLGRFRRENRKGAEGMEIMSIEPFKVEFESFHLMKSVLDYRGSKYFPIKEFYFKNPN
jgi:2'-5' RNA ligase